MMICLTNYLRIHSGEKSHQCPYCPYKSVRKDNLKSHLKTHEKHALEARRYLFENYFNNFTKIML